MKERVLAVCIHNSARSQMTEELIRKYGNDKFEVVSAGIEPGKINPFVAELLLEEDIDIRNKATRSVFDLREAGEHFDYVIAVCGKEAADACPVFPAEKKRIQWPFPDPSKAEGSDKEKLDYIRVIKEGIKRQVLHFIDGKYDFLES